MQNNTIEQLQPGADDRRAAVTEGGPEREVVFVDKQIRSLFLWFPAARGVNSDNDAMLRAASMASDIVIISMNYNSGGYVMNKADGDCGYTPFSRDRMTRLYHSGNSLVRTWYESSIVQEYCPYSEQVQYVLNRRVESVNVNYSVHVGRPRTTLAMMFVNAVNNGWLKEEVLQRLRRPFISRSQVVAEEVRALEAAVISTGMLRQYYSIDEAAALVQEQGQNFADKLNSMLAVKTNDTPSHASHT